MVKLLLLALLGALIAATPPAGAAGDERDKKPEVSVDAAGSWTSYKQRYGKIYASAQEDARRRDNYRASRRLVAEYNRAGRSIELGLNGMADWYEHEKRMVTGPANSLGAAAQSTSDASLEGECAGAELESFVRDFSAPAERVARALDWRDDPRRVGPVKKQQRCGSCWAHAAAGLLEGQQVARNFTRELVPLSEQQFLDCSGMHCLGGSVTSALAHAATGAQSSASYPYEAEKLDRCHFDEHKSVMRVRCALSLEKIGADRMKALLAGYGPLAVDMALPKVALFYKSGILTGEQCDETREENHSALIVGYGQDPKYGDFWIVKNSFGRNWGEDGYFRIQRGKNRCRIEEWVAAALF